MIIVTNRNLQPRSRPEHRFGKEFNRSGPDELRLAEAKKLRGKWQVDVPSDKVTFNGKAMFASEMLFLQLQERMRKRKRPCLFFVHGFNNDFESVLERGRQFERNYGVEVVAFTWPANGRGGGGLLGSAGGAVSYKSDKRDATRSATALDRTLEKLNLCLNEHEDTTVRCNQRLSLLMHSMGNYLFKTLMKSSVYQGESALFDNIMLVAADVNNKDHEQWVDKIQYRRRLYITINEDDSALRLSRMKFGDKQLARLGHFTQNLNSRNAIYLDFTKSRAVNEASHAYFEGKPIRENARIRSTFRNMLRGERAERRLTYNTHSRTYRIP